MCLEEISKNQKLAVRLSYFYELPATKTQTTMTGIQEIQDAIRTNDTERLSGLIRTNPALADAKTEQGISLLQFAAYCRNTFAIETLRSHKKRLDIFEAASLADIETVDNLSDQNTELVNSFSPDGFTPLGLASYFGHVAIVRLLLGKGADPNTPANNNFKVAPIHSACAISNYEIAHLLLKNGADVNSKQMQGVTPLHSAAHNGQTKLAELLLDFGADIHAKTDDGRTALWMAEEKGFAETAALLRQSGGQ